MQKHRICIIAPPNSIHTRRWIEYVKELNYFDIYYICFRDYWKPVEKTFFVTNRFHLPYSLFLLYAFLKTTLYLKTKKFDIIHSHFLYPYGIFLLFANSKKVISLWGSDVTKFYKESKQAKRLIFNLTIKNTDYIITPSEYFISFFDKKPKKWIKIIWGIDTSAVGKKDSSEKIKWGFSENETIICSIRGLRDIFQIERIVGAVRMLNELGIRNKLILIRGTDEKYNKSILKMCSDMPNVMFMKALDQNDFHSLLRASDIAISLAIRDGAPVSIKEAMYAGLPVIFQEIEPLNPVIKDGLTGFALKGFSKEELADKISFIVKNPEIVRKITLSAELHSVKEFDEETIKMQVRNFYQSINHEN